MTWVGSALVLQQMNKQEKSMGCLTILISWKIYVFLYPRPTKLEGVGVGGGGGWGVGGVGGGGGWGWGGGGWGGVGGARLYWTHLVYN